jgi:phage FluMu protein Com
MKVLTKDKNSNYKEIRCDCNRYLFTIKEKEIYIKCRRCKREHKVEITK